MAGQVRMDDRIRLVTTDELAKKVDSRRSVRYQGRIGLPSDGSEGVQGVQWVEASRANTLHLLTL